MQSTTKNEYYAFLKGRASVIFPEFIGPFSTVNEAIFNMLEKLKKYGFVSHYQKITHFGDEVSVDFGSHDTYIIISQPSKKE